MLAVDGLVRRASGSQERRQALERALIGLLEVKATAMCRRRVCEWLSEVGTPASVPVLARLLTDEELREPARFALERIPGDEAAAALRQAVAIAKGDARRGLVNSIGARRDRVAVPELVKLAGDPDVATASVAISAVGRIGGPDAVAYLAGATGLAGGAEQARADAYLACGERLAAEGRKRQAETIFASMLADGQPDRVRVAALRGLVRVNPDTAATRVLSFLAGANAPLRSAAAQLAGEIPGGDVTATAAERLPSLPVDAQLVLLPALARRGDGKAVNAVASLTESKDESVRVASVRALGVLGGTHHLPHLVALAAAGGGVGKAAAESLAGLSGDGMDSAIIAAARAGESAHRVAAVGSLAARGATAAVPALLDLAGDADGAVRAAVAAALGKLAGGGELPKLVALVAGARDGTGRKALAEALARAAGRTPDANAAAGPVVAGLSSADPEVSVSLLGVLRRIGGDKAVAAIGQRLEDQSADVRKAAIQALADCQTSAPRVQLLKAAAEDASEVNRVLALRGFVKQVAAFPDTPPEKAAGWLVRAMAVATRPDEKKTILACLPSFVCDASIELAERCLTEETLRAEAKLALHKMKMDGIRKFDFQLRGAPVMHDFVEINRTTLYTPKRGVGWDKAPAEERDRRKGTDLTRDFVFDAAPRTFRVNLPNGDYIVTVFMGDMSNPHDLAEIHAEGELKHKGITNRAGEVKELTFPVTVKDGVLDILFKDGGGGNPHWTCPGLVIGN